MELRARAAAVSGGVVPVRVVSTCSSRPRQVFGSGVEASEHIDRLRGDQG
ncbi:MAG: hypothetical protein ACTMII_00125 [Brachybacterium sp.]